MKKSNLLCNTGQHMNYAVMQSSNLQTKPYLFVTFNNNWEFKSFLVIINSSMIKTCQ